MAFLITVLILSLSIYAVSTTQQHSDNDTYVEQTCVMELLQSDKNVLYDEATNVVQCLTGTQHQDADRVQQKESMLFLVTNIKKYLQCNESGSENERRIVKLFCENDFESEMKAGNDTLIEYYCVKCLLFQFRKILQLKPKAKFLSNATDLFQVNNTSDFRENFSILLLLTYYKLTKSSSRQLSSVWIRNFLDIRNWEKYPRVTANENKLIETLDELKTVKLGKMNFLLLFHNVYPVFIISFLFISVGFVGNGILLIIFIRHKKLRRDTNLMVFNQTIAHFLFIILGTCMMFDTSLIEQFWRCDPKAVGVAFIWLVLTGVCIDSVMMMTIQRYFAVISTSRPPTRYEGLFCRSSTLQIFVVWLIAIFLSFPMTCLYLMNPVKHMRAIFIYSFFTFSAIPVIVVTTLLIAISRKLRQSVLNMPGEDVGQELTKRSRNRSAKLLIVLSIAFTVSYLPTYLINIFLIFSDAPPESFILYFAPITYMLMFINSCVNPIALYVSSVIFRSHFNQYICCGYSGGSESRKRNSNYTPIRYFSQSLIFERQESTSYV